ncbi:MAG: LytTR family DNA-binding domain-containing protein [Clostridiales Family XIII bacterium]|nr:LytTR family DNA-binding domain-containing protein [Clostridiales Family XIII bacterium]
MKIVICEDEIYYTNELKTSISKWAAMRGIDCRYSCFSSSQGLISHLTNNMDTDVLFLDISLGEKADGMILAHHIRKACNPVPIIFVTSYQNRAPEGYLVDAVGFLDKPVDPGKLALFLDKIVNLQVLQKTVQLTANGHSFTVPYNDILYVEINNHTLIYHTATHGDINFRGTLYDVLSSLDGECFIQIYRSYVIALHRINSIKPTQPYAVNLLNNDNTLITLPVSGKYIGELMEIYSTRTLGRMI